MPEFLKDVVIAMLVGAYAGWVVVRYLAFQKQLREARRLAYGCADVLQRMLRHNGMIAAEAECSGLLMEPAANLQRLGFREAAHAMTSSSQGAQLGLFGFWQRVKACEANGDIQGRETELRALRQFEKDIISDINKTRLGIAVLLLGPRFGGLSKRRQRQRARTGPDGANGRGTRNSP